MFNRKYAKDARKKYVNDVRRKLVVSNTSGFAGNTSEFFLGQAGGDPDFQAQLIQFYVKMSKLNPLACDCGHQPVSDLSLQQYNLVVKGHKFRDSGKLKRAMAAYKEAAVLGNAEGQYDLACLTGNNKKLLRWAREAAEPKPYFKIGGSKVHLDIGDVEVENLMGKRIQGQQGERI
ncbi:hypothetical protein SARC_02980 [Sphaeroforma arctica JP610]|uniref:Uncharacterized protein n=1 Tax=Sphaeroforma arctica JP610 TaxID=667725 RepID=A0A0L0G715_9EUKA|nr:hypothetical protein SARC_02980 [Sphaeroforma arctica JP610]KNC84805.1 hypothetical protein SARC_02980 [Sphaeroforma arctica JP610]|eukprot:XP_014158707.1 hypothetical protein SARC_02980 [Sphaeroforma arctica JP610]